MPQTLHRRGPSSVPLCLEQLEHRSCPALVVPALSSLPGANHTIYLDFDSHITQNTSWNTYFNKSTIVSPAYDTDNNPNTFSAGELAEIKEIWNRVAEDYIPFQVNVTTVDPGVAALQKSGLLDTRWGIRVVLTKDTENARAGGLAFAGSFNWDSDTPAFVYATGGKYAGEAASHETGHTLYLSHDGDATSGYATGHGIGETSWAPIMGLGYSQNVTQWDRAEFAGATNRGLTANNNHGPDDLYVITTYNGFGYRVDDHGNTFGNASPLHPTGTSVGGVGIIETRTDTDVFTFVTGSGTVNLTINPFTPGPNLDVQAELFDANGSLITSVNPAGSLSANISLNLAAGQYFLRIDGAGVGTPTTGYSDYASLGRYFINGTVVPTGSVPPGTGSSSPGTPPPDNSGVQLTIADVWTSEEDYFFIWGRETSTKTFTVNLTAPSAQTVTVDYTTVNGSARGDGDDYISTAGTLVFQPGETSQTISVTILGDRTVEGDEVFSVLLENPQNASLADDRAVGTILGDDLDVDGASATLQPIVDHFDHNTGSCGCGGSCSVCVGMAVEDHHEPNINEPPVTENLSMVETIVEVHQTSTVEMPFSTSLLPEPTNNATSASIPLTPEAEVPVLLALLSPTGHQSEETESSSSPKPSASSQTLPESAVPHLVLPFSQRERTTTVTEEAASVDETEDLVAGLFIDLRVW